MPGTCAEGIWRALGERGALRELYRDSGSRVRVDLTRARELMLEVDARCSLGVALGVCVQISSALPALLDAGSGEVARAVAESALRGEAVVALAATDDAAAGSDLTALGTSVRIDGDRVVVDGGKRWITNATRADHFLVLARHRPGEHFTSFTTVLVPANAPGVSTEAATTRLFDGSGIGSVRLDQVRLDAAHLVGRPGQGLARFAHGMIAERLVGGAWAAALLRRVLVETYRHLAGARRGGAPLWDDEVVRRRFARCVLVQRRLDALCRTAEDAAHAMVVKASAAEAVDEVLAECAALRGAEAFGTGGLHELRAAAAMWGVAGGTTDTMLGGIAAHTRQLLEPLP
ncbi:acyl-CoA dehydrogenase [Saccharothrix coeruleofusca]|uniref:Citronellyl-CoA dehydrogenase n=1 Tax=Saccharothrix coeruleofusca TaxID=33919 RepID=A0A918ASM6_9PSEU|nr:acyl-CoA dehydrogenase [Saccharothrix coeruleofusca]MBP2336700.1 citronellyl-CoA dehydrogenase [Saccharothrix coeruleofusca]GGP78650.1 hypothetical protein GCM10010185_60580 [Saccharothrix coeruleofusca]